MSKLEEGSYRIVPGEYYGTPKEVWGFRSPRATGDPKTISRRWMAANRGLLGLTGILGRFRRPRVIESLGAWHVIRQQEHAGARVHRAYVTVHIGRDRRVYMAKNRAMPREFLPEPYDPRISPQQAEGATRRFLEYARSESDVIGEPELLWFPWEDELVLAYKVRLHVHAARPREEWIVYVDAVTREVLDYIDNLAAARGRARVFDPNPVIALGDHRRALTPSGRPRRAFPDEVYTTVDLEDLDGTGRLDGKRVTTAPTGEDRAFAEDHEFVYRATHRGFEEAMAYYHIDRAIRWLEDMGYRGGRAIFDGPLPVNVRATARDSSWYSPGHRMLNFGLGGGVNDAEDAETILHEFGHALQDAICPDFGQSVQAAAMGEGFGDYLAMSFFAHRKRPPYDKTVMSWDGITWEENDPPCVRNLDTELTFESFDGEASEHDNGRIWGATLLDVRAALGRATADELIVESHFQLDGFTTFARGARAILDADDNLRAGRHRGRLRRIFQHRGIGPLH